MALAVVPGYISRRIARIQGQVSWFTFRPVARGVQGIEAPPLSPSHQNDKKCSLGHFGPVHSLFKFRFNHWKYSIIIYYWITCLGIVKICINRRHISVITAFVNIGLKGLGKRNFKRFTMVPLLSMIKHEFNLSMFII